MKHTGGNERKTDLGNGDIAILQSSQPTSPLDPAPRVAATRSAVSHHRACMNLPMNLPMYIIAVYACARACVCSCVRVCTVKSEPC
jgi:hypothetical protein